ncbi:hypothetical protein Avbf_09274 [Armadillidium vulgare]|nr:hypothetical protein Avbf_09274 [Armadillidium vulgare]
MFASMKGILEGYEAAQENGFFHLITESPYVSATHVVAYHLINALTNNKNLVFVALQNSWGHYCEIANKFGINLRSKQYENCVKVLNSFKFLTEVTEDENVKNIFSFINDNNSFKIFALHVRELILKFKEQKTTYCTYNRRLCSDTLSETLDNIVAVCTEDDFSKSLVNHLRREASICFSVQGLSTGISQDLEDCISSLGKFYKFIREREKGIDYLSVEYLLIY